MAQIQHKPSRFISFSEELKAYLRVVFAALFPSGPCWRGRIA